jgi:hypothetical protein
VILDTDGLWALAKGEPALEPLLRRAAQVAIPVITGTEFHSLVTTFTTNSGWPSTCRAFEFSTSMNRLPSSIVRFARSQ